MTEAIPSPKDSHRRATPVDVLEDSVLIKRGAVQLFRLVQLATELAAAPDLDALLRTITEGLTRLLVATRTTIYVYDEKTGEIWSRVADRLEIREIRLPLGRGIAGQAAKTRQLIHVPDVSKSEHFAPEIDRKTGFVTRSILAAPMLNMKRELIGIVEVLNKKTWTFTEDDEELLRLFASYAANAIEAQILEEAMRRRERMAAVGALAGSIVHDIRNMAALVNGWIDLIQPGAAAGTGSTREIVDVVHGEIDKMVDLTEEVLDFARGIEGQVVPHRVDVDRTLQDVLRVLEREFQINGVKLEFVPGGAGPAKLDVRRFRRVVLNLGQNARKVLPRGGTLKVTTRRDPEKKTCHIEFEDDGPGIPDAIRPRLFTPFTSAGEHGGTGLGLAICKSIVEAHGGTIGVRDRKPQGTIFEISVPGDTIGASGQYPLDKA
ncbi:GAF domain-containing sensor histidine kinase [bacterium]|nr:GAF domain-containing sensor histidine kinase [bacterium]